MAEATDEKSADFQRDWHKAKQALVQSRRSVAAHRGTSAKPIDRVTGR